MKETAAVETTWDDGLDDLVAAGLVTREDNWKLADWVAWFGGYVEDAYHASKEALSHAEFMARPDGHVAQNVIEATAASYGFCYGAPLEHPLPDVSLDTLQLEECECLLRQHIHILHHRAHLERIAPFYWWRRSFHDLSDEEVVAFAYEMLRALTEAGTEQMQAFFYRRYNRDILIAYMNGDDSVE